MLSELRELVDRGNLVDPTVEVYKRSRRQEEATPPPPGPEVVPLGEIRDSRQR